MTNDNNALHAAAGLCAPKSDMAANVRTHVPDFDMATEIIRIIGCHDALFEALKEIANADVYYDDLGGDIPRSQINEVVTANVVKIAKAALELAKGEVHDR
ncbi:hypothetical protein [Micavibrio aeruginosavorus]|uniref:Uncharacterized protein n=1 Tax=Micavibrio aeruginosavorus (strain ARL-13) TaxID=856793 RepID=G2KMZ6_MICAA|nr:hypothetical protein [Micavibrio aeruginosavorus]AEP08928.1 hypothetical protein MICA_591 [Micavibrio aeruginosavorus ARL-13]